MKGTWHHRTVAVLLSPPLALLSMLAGPMLAGPMLAGPMLAGPMLAGPMLAGPMLTGPTLAGPSGQRRMSPPTAVAAERGPIAEAGTVRAVVVAGPRRVAPVRTGFRWPLSGTPRVVRRFDPPAQPWQRGHRGVDLAAPSGAVVRAAGPGVVHFAGMVAGRPVVSVSHADGLRSTYEPVRADVKAGDQVRPGDPLGVLLAGHPGCVAAACLHWGLRRGDEYLDPLLLLGLGRVRLLPVASVSSVASVASVLSVPSVAVGGRSGQGGEQGRQAFGEPLVLLRPVVDLAGQA